MTYAAQLKLGFFSIGTPAAPITGRLFGLILLFLLGNAQLRRPDDLMTFPFPSPPFRIRVHRPIPPLKMGYIVPPLEVLSVGMAGGAITRGGPIIMA